MQERKANNEAIRIEADGLRAHLVECLEEYREARDCGDDFMLKIIRSRMIPYMNELEKLGSTLPVIDGVDWEEILQQASQEQNQKLHGPKEN
jgi:hypothetical protein